MKNPKRALLVIPPVLAIALAVYLVRPKTAPEPEEPTAVVPTAATAPHAATIPTIDPDLPLGEKRNRLLLLNRDEARAWVLRELESGTDFATGMDLALGTDQNLTSWPSYRVFLIDLLFQIDPELAAAKSRDLVETSESPDEWAVALRNVAKADSEGRATGWLRDKATALVRNEAWKTDPSAGYLNAFDVIVHARHTALTPELMVLADNPEAKALRHASFLAIDRLVQVSPEEMLPSLAGTADRYPRSGPMLSNLMARADVREENQRAALERYLLDEKRTEEELTSFAHVFPNANFHISNNLLTRTEGIDGITLAEQDRATLEVIRGWLEDERFSRIHSALRIAESRLSQFVEKSGEN